MKNVLFSLYLLFLCLMANTLFSPLSAQEGAYHCPHNHEEPPPPPDSPDDEPSQDEPPTSICIDYLRVNVHYMLKCDGTGNFRPYDDGLGDPSFTGYDFAEWMIRHANGNLGPNHVDPVTCGPATDNPDWRYKLNGVYFHEDDEQYYYDPSNYLAFIGNSPSAKNVPFDDYGQDKDNTINVFVMQTLNGTFWGGVAEWPSHGNRFFILANGWSKYHVGDQWQVFNVYNHEMGHVFNMLYHTQNSVKPCGVMGQANCFCGWGATELTAARTAIDTYLAPYIETCPAPVGCIEPVIAWFDTNKDNYCPEESITCYGAIDNSQTNHFWSIQKSNRWWSPIGTEYSQWFTGPVGTFDATNLYLTQSGLYPAPGYYRVKLAVKNSDDPEGCTDWDEFVRLVYIKPYDLCDEVCEPYGNNAVANPYFEDYPYCAGTGAGGFSSDLTLVCSPTLSPGTYAVERDAQAWSTINDLDGRSSDCGSNNFLLGQGLTTDQVAWNQSVFTRGGQQYYFSAHVRNLCTDCVNTNRPVLEARVLGLGNTVIINSGPIDELSGWVKIYGNYQASVDALQELEIVIKGNGTAGNYFGTDDIYFGEAHPKAYVGPDRVVCEGDMIGLNTVYNADYSYNWTMTDPNNNVSNIGNTHNVAITAGAPGVYRYRVDTRWAIDPSCESWDEVLVEVLPAGSPDCEDVDDPPGGGGSDRSAGADGLQKVDAARLSIFPNPTHTRLNILLEKQELASSQLTIINNLGQRMYQAQLDIGGSIQESIEVQNWPAGIYYLTIWSNGKRYQQKFTVLK